jgi:hydrogenase maturation protein HypF
MSVEAAAAASDEGGAYPYEVRGGEGEAWVVDPAPMLREVSVDVERGLPPALIASRFHETLARMVTDVCRRIRECEGVDDVALTGGVFVNALLSSSASLHLTRAGFRVHRHREVPPNDGGLCLGQLAVAAALDAAGSA